MPCLLVFAAATWIEIDPESGEEIVRGFAKIEKARWKLVRLSSPSLPVLLLSSVPDLLLLPRPCRSVSSAPSRTAPRVCRLSSSFLSSSFLSPSARRG